MFKNIEKCLINILEKNQKKFKKDNYNNFYSDNEEAKKWKKICIKVFKKFNNKYKKNPEKYGKLTMDELYEYFIKILVQNKKI